MSGSFLPEVKSTAGPSARFTGSASSSMRADTTVKTGWTPMRAIIIMLCFGVNMVDGVDVLMLSYVAPTFERLGLTSGQLGMLFSAGLAGMAVGGLLLAPLSDKTGRRPLILFSVALMSICMIASGYATTMWHLVVLRLGVGAGIGAALASISTLAAEYAPPKHHDFAVAMLQGGYPIAATITGFIVAPLINSWSWESLLLGAGLFSASAILPLFFSCLNRRPSWNNASHATRSVASIVSRSASGCLFLPLCRKNPRLNRIIRASQACSVTACFPARFCSG